MSERPSRPYLCFDGDPNSEALKRVLWLREHGGLGLVPGDRCNEANEALLQAVDDLIVHSRATDTNGEHEYADHAETAALAREILLGIAGPYLDCLSESEISLQVSGCGGLDRANLLMRDLAYDFARIYFLTADERAASRAALILAHLAEVMPTWPLISRDGRKVHQDDQAYWKEWQSNGLWGVSFHDDLDAGLPLARTFDLIFDSGAMTALGSEVPAIIERNLIRHMAEYYLRRPLDLSNLCDRAIRCLVLFGQAIPEPAYMHRALERYRYMINAVFYADGFWHEGSPAYHRDLAIGLTQRIPEVLRAYTEDDLDLAVEYERQHQRIWGALGKLRFHGTADAYAKIHDSDYDHWAAWDEPPTESRLLGCMGHAVLGTTGRTGGEPAPFQIHLHYSGTHGHEHHDALNIILFAHGRELISETQYRPIGGDHLSSYQWHRATAAHNTVVMDRSDQLNRRNGNFRQLGDEDLMRDIPSGANGYRIPEIPHWQDRQAGHGSSSNDPRLRCFYPNWDPVQIVEVEAERAYALGPEQVRPQLYRRTIALIQTDIGNAETNQAYGVDIFRVQGGSHHEWMLHGCLQEHHKLVTTTTPRSSARHNWLGKTKHFTTSDGWWAELVSDGEKASLRTHMLGQPDTMVGVGWAPAMRRTAEAPFLNVRRDDQESCFVAAHDPYLDSHNVESIANVSWDVEPTPSGLSGSGSMCVGIVVRLASGFTDIVLSSPEDPPFPTEHTGIASELISGGITFAGRFAHLRFKPDEHDQLQLVHAHAVDTSLLILRDLTLRGAGFLRGEITATHRVEAGADRDAFAVTFDPDSPCRGQHMAKLGGHYLVLDLGGQLTQAFMIAEVEPTADGAMIYTEDEPGMEIRSSSDGRIIKMMYYPGWTIRGVCRFHITNALHWP